MTSRTFTVQLGGVAYTLHRLKLGQIEDLGLLQIQKLPEIEAMAKALDALVLAAQPSHPGLQRKELADVLEVDDIALLMPAIMSAAGFAQVREQLGNLLGMTLPGAGQPSTPTSPPAST